jgi:hypothetical protein
LTRSGEARWELREEAQVIGFQPGDSAFLYADANLHMAIPVEEIGRARRQ